MTALALGSPLSSTSCRSPLVMLVLISVMLSLLGCGSDGGSPNVMPDASPDASPDAMPLSASCVEAANHSDLAWIQDSILTPGCASFRSCHQGAATQAGGLNLETGNSLAGLSRISSVRFTDWKLVVPGAPERSYLMVLLIGDGGPISPEVGTMPFGNPKLCAPKIEAISRWITNL